MKCESQFSGKNKKQILKCCLLQSLSSMQSIKTMATFVSYSSDQMKIQPTSEGHC